MVLTLIVLLTVLLIPVQIDRKITYIIILYALTQLPLLVKDFRKVFTENRKVILVFLVFLTSLSLSTIFSVNIKQSLPILALFWSYFVIYLTSGLIFNTHKKRESLSLMIILITFVLSLISFYNTLISGYNNKEQEGVSFLWLYFGHNHLSALLLFSIPLTYYFLVKKWQTQSQKVLIMVTFLFAVVSLYLTFARASIISLLLALMMSAILFKLVPRKIALILTLLLIIAGGGILFDLSINAKNINLYKSGVVLNARSVYWEQAIKNVAKNPLFGTGLDTYRFSIFKNDKGKVLHTYYAHNFFLQMLSDAGILGFLSSMSLIGLLFYQSFKKISEKLKSREGQLMLVMWIGILASTINSLVDFDWQLPTIFLIFWILVGLI